jgi:hypothetical protein
LGPAAAPTLAASLPERTAALLVERLVTGLPAALPLAAEVELAAMIVALPGRLETEPARAAITTAAAALSTPAAVSAESVRKVVMLARLAVALAVLRGATITIWGRPPGAQDLAPEALEHLPEAARRLVQAALPPLGEAAPVRTALARVLDRVTTASSAPSVAATRAAETPGPAHAITSRIAGIGLLMPTALAYGLPERLSRAAFNRTLAAVLGAEAAGAARLDPLLAALAPFNPRERDDTYPPVPANLRSMVPASRREGETEEEGAAGWAACLIYGFAAGLRGFEASSLGYLRRQFLARPGTLHVGERRFTLAIEPLPLGILLRLSGLHGWTGRLPQALDAMLRIEIRES